MAFIKHISSKPLLTGSSLKQWQYRLIGLVVLLLIQGCSTLNNTPPPLPTQSSTPIPDTWDISAKLGIRNQQKNASLTVKWQQQQAQFTIRVSGPLGQGSGVLTGNDNAITIERPNKETIYSQQPSLLIEDTFGWALPIEHLRFWVRGLPSPQLDTPIQQYNELGLLSTLAQSGWILRYDRYKPVSEWVMPHRIKAEKDNIQLTLLIKQWQLNP